MQTNKEIGDLDRGCAFGEGVCQQDNKEVSQANKDAKGNRGCAPREGIGQNTNKEKPIDNAVL